MARIFYRVGQFWKGLWATIAPDELRRVATILPPAAFPLFTQMPVDAQRHSLNVLGSIEVGKVCAHHSDLEVAALLHDCGKVAAAQGGVDLELWLRGPFVVLEKLFPKVAARWSSPSQIDGWRYALYVQREHPAIGAAWAAEAGCSQLSCWLIANHQGPPAGIDHKKITLSTSGGSEVGYDEALGLLSLLQAADDGN